MPANGSSDTLFRLELAEDGNFTSGYLAFAGLVETVYQVSNLKPNTQYFVRLQAYQPPHDENNPQVYLGTEENNESSADSQVRTFAPSEPEIADATTIRNALLHPTNIELTIGHGKFSAKWDHPANASGKTNLLEAIAMIATTRSPRRAADIDLVSWDAIADDLALGPAAELVPEQPRGPARPRARPGAEARGEGAEAAAAWKLEQPY